MSSRGAGAGGAPTPRRGNVATAETSASEPGGRWFVRRVRQDARGTSGLRTALASGLGWVPRRRSSPGSPVRDQTLGIHAPLDGRSLRLRRPLSLPASPSFFRESVVGRPRHTVNAGRTSGCDAGFLVSSGQAPGAGKPRGRKESRGTSGRSATAVADRGGHSAKSPHGEEVRRRTEGVRLETGTQLVLQTESTRRRRL